MRTWIAIAMLAALGCGGAVGDIEDTTDGEEGVSTEPVELGQTEQALTTQKANPPLGGNADLRVMGTVRVPQIGGGAIGMQCFISNVGLPVTCVVPNTKTMGYSYGVLAQSALKLTVDAIKGTVASQSGFTFTEQASGGGVQMRVGALPNVNASIESYVKVGFGPTFQTLTENPSSTGTWQLSVTQMTITIDNNKINADCTAPGMPANCADRTFRHALAYGMYNVMGVGGTVGKTVNNFATGKGVSIAGLAVDRITLPTFQQCLGQQYAAGSPTQITFANNVACGTTANGY